MRSLAAALGTGPMTLYNYVKDREELEGLVAEAVLADVACHAGQTIGAPTSNPPRPPSGGRYASTPTPHPGADPPDGFSGGFPSRRTPHRSAQPRGP